VFEQISGRMFYKIFRFLTGIEQPDNIVTARLMRKVYVEALCSYKERELNIGGVLLDTGFRQKISTVKKRDHSPTTYTIPKKIDHLINAITSFSSSPLKIVFYLGITLTITSIIYIFYLLGLQIFATPPSGYTSTIASIWFFSGIIILFQGIQGIYISKIFNEAKQRPYSIIRKLYHKK